MNNNTYGLRNIASQDRLFTEAIWNHFGSRVSTCAVNRHVVTMSTINGFTVVVDGRFQFSVEPTSPTSPYDIEACEEAFELLRARFPKGRLSFGDAVSLFGLIADAAFEDIVFEKTMDLQMAEMAEIPC